MLFNISASPSEDFKMGVPTVNWNANASFNPWTQHFPILLPDGTTSMMAKMDDVFVVQSSAVNQSISMASQVGASVILLVALLLITRSEKRRSMVFIFNLLSLLFVALRGIMALCVTTGPLYNFYRYETGYYDSMGHAKGVSAAGEIFSFLLTLTITVSLVMQVKIVCCNLTPSKRLMINVLNIVTVFTACSVRFALMVLNIVWNILNVESETMEQFDTIGVLAMASNITLVATIGISAVIFCTKLGIAIYHRRTMGMTQFGPMQIIFVMGFQTMCTPFIFTIIVYFGVPDGQITSFVPTIVALSLPLSAMWATVNTMNVHIATPHANPRAIPVGNPNMSSVVGMHSKEKFDGTMNTASTLVDNDSTGSKTKCHGSASQRLSDYDADDFETHRFSNGRDVENGNVYVDRTYSVRTG